MVQLNARGFKPRIIQILNEFSMHLHVVTIADIINPQGAHIVQCAIDGIRTCALYIKWSKTATPTHHNWAL